MESAFKTPSETAYYLRQRFHSFRKESTENAEVWYQRIESCLSGCDYGDLDTFMFIDKFISGFDHSIFERIKPFTILGHFNSILGHFI